MDDQQNDAPKFKTRRTKTANLNQPPKKLAKPSTNGDTKTDELADIAPDETSGGAGDHLDTFRAADLDLIATVQDAVRDVDETGAFLDEEPDDDTPAPPDALSTDAFYTVFELGFSVPQMINPVFAPVAIQPGEQQQARGASDAVYKLLEIYYPRALMPMGDTVALLLASGMFFAAKASVAKACFAELRQREIEARREAMRQQNQGAVPDNQNEPPKAANSGGAPSKLDWMDKEQGAA